MGCRKKVEIRGRSLPSKSAACPTVLTRQFTSGCGSFSRIGDGFAGAALWLLLVAAALSLLLVVAALWLVLEAAAAGAVAGEFAIASTSPALYLGSLR